MRHTGSTLMILALAALFVPGPRKALGAFVAEVQLPICAQPFPVLSFNLSRTTVSVTKQLDACTPNIFAAVSNGTVLNTVTLTAGKSSVAYDWVFQDVVLTSDSGSGGVPTETVTWKFGLSNFQWQDQAAEKKRPVKISRYASNLRKGDSVAHMTNSGDSGATGPVCANIYAFTPDEQMVSCCSCPVTPNGLVSLSANNDLASNTLTPAVPDALVIALVTTLPEAGSCNNSAATVTSATLAPGIAAWGTTIHATPAAGTFAVTETAFAPDSISIGELDLLGSLCGFIVANGSGFGVCRSCRLGGLGATSQ
jgi:hypothetical protein